MSAYRKSALAIHSLSSKDRRWVLTRLSAQQRTTLQPLLVELKSLGIPQADLDPALIAEPGQTAAVALNSRKLELVDKATNDEMRALLGDESATVIAAIVSIHDWSWRQNLLSGYPRARREAVARGLELGRRNGLSAQLQQAILGSLAHMLINQREPMPSQISSKQASASQPGGGFFKRLGRFMWPAS